MIGANSVVTTDVAPYSIVGGVPARVLKQDWRLPGVGRARARAAYFVVISVIA